MCCCSASHVLCYSIIPDAAFMQFQHRSSPHDSPASIRPDVNAPSLHFFASRFHSLFNARACSIGNFASETQFPPPLPSSTTASPAFWIPDSQRSISLCWFTADALLAWFVFYRLIHWPYRLQFRLVSTRWVWSIPFGFSNLFQISWSVRRFPVP